MRKLDARALTDLEEPFLLLLVLFETQTVKVVLEAISLFELLEEDARLYPKFSIDHPSCPSTHLVPVGRTDSPELELGRRHGALRVVFGKSDMPLLVFSTRDITSNEPSAYIYDWPHRHSGMWRHG